MWNSSKVFEKLYNHRGTYVKIVRPLNHRKYDVKLYDGLVYITDLSGEEKIVTIDTALELWPFSDNFS